MLIIGRKRNQKIIISDNIEITILEIGRNRGWFSIEAPKEVRVQTKVQRADGEPTSEQHTRAKTAYAGRRH